MKFTSTTVAGVALAGAALVSAQNETTTCSSGVHIIIARGSGEEPGPGRMGVVADAVEEAIPGSSIESVDYPAIFANYSSSVADGVEAMGEALTRYTEKCPDNKVVLMGFSQGAHVTMDLLCGGDEEGHIWSFGGEPPYDAEIVNKSVAAVVVYGDPTHSAEHPWNEGNSTNDGLFARVDSSACLQYAPMLRSWCDEGDRYCDLGNNTVTHGSYFGIYTNDTVDFVVERFEAATEEDDEDETPTSSEVPSGTASPTPSGSGDAEDGDSAAGVVAVSWGVLAAAGIATFMSL